MIMITCFYINDQFSLWSIANFAISGLQKWTGPTLMTLLYGVQDFVRSGGYTQVTGQIFLAQYKGEGKGRSRTNLVKMVKIVRLHEENGKPQKGFTINARL